MSRALEKRTIFFISGNTAITAETMGMSLLCQFDQIRFDRITLPFVNTIEKAKQTVSQINRVSRETGRLPVVFSTLVDDQVRKLIMGCDCEFIDFFDAFPGPLEKILGKRSAHAVGRYHAPPVSFSSRLRNKPTTECTRPLLGDSGRDAGIGNKERTADRKSPSSLLSETGQEGDWFLPMRGNVIIVF